jgi:hypothetical protein
MKWFLILWGGPILLLGSWYGLSYNDLSFGFFMLTRETHDLVFQVYSEILGIPAEELPPLVARAVVVDSLIVFAIIAFRRRRKIASWWRSRQEARSSALLASDESLSRAP